MAELFILIATKNRHKAEELAALIIPASSAAGAVSLADWEAESRLSLPAPEENGRAFVENALSKARSYAAAASLPALADDSGLSVAALGGAPGVFSARYGGPGLTDQDRSRLLIDNMENVRDRRAFFTSVLALARPDGQALFWERRVYGLIARAARGENGFGYDPVFYHPPSRRTFAQLTAVEKNSISHRALAARHMQADWARVRRFLNLRR